MERVLITGGAGFIGRFVADELLQRGHEVRVFDALIPQVTVDERRLRRGRRRLTQVGEGQLEGGRDDAVLVELGPPRLELVRLLGRTFQIRKTVQVIYSLNQYLILKIHFQ